MAHPQTNFSSNFQGVDPPLEGYWHDDPIPCGGGNVVTDIWPNPAGVPVVVKGFNALTAEDIVDKLDKTGNASNTTSAFTKATGDTSTMTSGSKLSVIFTAISSFFASVVSALGSKYTKPSSGIPKTDLASDVQTSLGKADTALQSHQSVTDNNPTLAWGTTSEVGKVGSTDLRVTMPANPASGKEDAFVRNGAGSPYVIFEKDISTALYDGQRFEMVSSRGNNTYKIVGRLRFPATTSASPLNGCSLVFASYPEQPAFEFYYKLTDIGASTRLTLVLRLLNIGNSVVTVKPTNMSMDVVTTYDTAGFTRLDTFPALINMRDASWINSGTFDAARIPAVGLKSNTATLYISSYSNTTPVYHVKDIKNGCVNYVHVKDTLSSSCNLTIEAPALAADEEYDYVVVFDTFTNNNLVGNIDVENCKTTGHFESGVFVHDTMAISSTAPSQVPMIIVTGNVARPQWYDRV